MITVWKKVIIASKNVGAGLVPLEAFGGLYQQAQWLGLQSIIMVKRVRHLWNKTTCEVQFYLSSLPADAQKIGNAIRRSLAQKSKRAAMDNNYMMAVLKAFCQA